MKQRIPYNILSLFASLLFLVAGMFIWEMELQPPSLPDVAGNLEKHLHEQEEEVEKFARDEVLLQQIITGNISAAQVQQLNQKPQVLLIYRNDSLIFWNKNLAFPPQNIYHYDEHDEVINLKNGFYELIRKEANISGTGKYEVIGLIPLKYRYEIQNRFLQNRLALNKSYDQHIGFSLTTAPEALPVLNERGEPLFYIYAQEGFEEPEPTIVPLILFALSAFFFLLFINFIAVAVSRRVSPIAGSIFLVIIFMFLRWVSIFYAYPFLVKYYNFFDPHFYATAFAPSLGDLLINILLALWAIIFFYRMVPVQTGLKKLDSFVGTTISYTAILLLLLMISRVIRSLVIDSHISFNINNFLSLNIFSIIGLVCIGLMILGLYLFTYRLILINRASKRYISQNSMALGVAAILFTLLAFELSFSFLYILLLGISFIVILTFFIFRRVYMLGFTSIIFWLIFFSFYTALLFNKYISKKEWESRKQYAYTLAEEKDVIGEYLFSEVREKILADPFIKGYFQNPFIPRSELVERIKKQYLKDNLRRYDISVHTFIPPNVPYKEDQDISFSDIVNRIDSLGKRTRVDMLYFIPNNAAPYKYVAVLPIYDPGNDNLLGRLVIKFFSQTFSFANVYPELLLQEDLKLSSEFENYDHAVYSEYKLQKNRGEYPYDLRMDTTISRSEFGVLQEPNYQHLIYTPDEGESIWISKPRLSRFEPLSLFSYIFCFYLFLIIIMLIIRAGYILYKNDMKYREVFSISFRNRIQLFVIAIIVVSFLLIGGLTILNINRQYEDYHHQRLLRKVKQVQAGLEYMKNEVDRLPSSWSRLFASEDIIFQNITSLSDIHSMDINIYDTEGDLITSSQPSIVEKGLVTQKIDPVAHHYITRQNKSQFIQMEQIGKLEYLSAYVPITNEDREVVGILNLPYFAKEKNLENEISDFLVYFINVYVLLLVVAGIIGLMISNTITRPITEIGSKLKKLRLGERNEPINWRIDDEIGRLVNEYNKMISELEHSAELLAKSERESAWREMAKQVAHEIKNPLTPMKLSIQHLQRAYRERSPNLDTLINNVTNTLIEQIENLNSIASEFSSFAKMPVANKEFLSLNEILKSVTDLYKNEETAEIDLHLPSEEYYIFADKGQMIRVFNNLIKNATQAIPDERTGAIFIAMKKDDGKVRVKIEDNGIGIPPEQKEKVFVPSFTTKGSGMGLGLAITKNIIESAGGAIWFDSEPGVGTTFYIELPVFSDSYVKKQIS